MRWGFPKSVRRIVKVRPTSHITAFSPRTYRFVSGLVKMSLVIRWPLVYKQRIFKIPEKNHIHSLGEDRAKGIVSKCFEFLDNIYIRHRLRDIFLIWILVLTSNDQRWLVGDTNIFSNKWNWYGDSFWLFLI